jgi:hypothetical protein
MNHRELEIVLSKGNAGVACDPYRVEIVFGCFPGVALRLPPQRASALVALISVTPPGSNPLNPPAFSVSPNVAIKTID